MAYSQLKPQQSVATKLGFFTARNVFNVKYLLFLNDMLLEVYKLQKDVTLTIDDKNFSFLKDEILKAYEGSNYETGYYDIFLLRELDRQVFTINLLSILREKNALKSLPPPF